MSGYTGTLRASSQVELEKVLPGQALYRCGECAKHNQVELENNSGGESVAGACRRVEHLGRVHQAAATRRPGPYTRSRFTSTEAVSSAKSLEVIITRRRRLAEGRSEAEKGMIGSLEGAEVQQSRKGGSDAMKGAHDWTGLPGRRAPCAAAPP
jgi:hypothetical protein